MAVQCAKCGEELMGSVNRCWRCGQEFVARNTDPGLPPIRRNPVVNSTAEVFVAELSEATTTAPEVHNASNAAGCTQPTNRVRRGSPFGDRGTATLVTIEPELAVSEQDAALEREARYQKNGGAAASAALTLPLGLIGLLAAFLFPLAGVLLAVLGLGFGIWGLKSRRRGLVVAGLLLCCLSLAIAAFNGLVEIYVSQHGLAPWETNSSLP